MLMRRWPVVIILLAGVLSSVTYAGGGLRRGGGGYPLPPPITNITVGSPFRYLDNYPTYYIVGDTWLSALADDDNTYVTCNDCSLPQGDYNSTFQSIVITTMALTSAPIGKGPPPNPILTLAPGNGISQLGNYNGAASDGASRSFKSTGLICLPGTSVTPSAPHGVLYLNVRRYIYPTGSNYFMNSQILKSTDYANSWSPLPPGAPPPSNQPYASPQFAANGVNTLGGYFQYGRCYADAGPDNSNAYVYAFVSDSSNIGTGSTQWTREWLARVPIGGIDTTVASAANWQYYIGPVGASDGGTNASYWSSTFSTSTATIVVDATGMTSVTGGALCCSQDALWLPHYRQYLHLTAGGGTSPNVGGFFWTAPHPWGKWTLSGQSNTMLGGFTSPITSSLVNGGQSLQMMVAGDPNTNSNGPGSNLNTYTMYIYPMTISP